MWLFYTYPITLHPCECWSWSPVACTWFANFRQWKNWYFVYKWMTQFSNLPSSIEMLEVVFSWFSSFWIWAYIVLISFKCVAYLSALSKRACSSISALMSQCLWLIVYMLDILINALILKNVVREIMYKTTRSLSNYCDLNLMLFIFR